MNRTSREALSSKPWTRATLKAVGGTAGIGVTFLEETFAAKTANALYRAHQPATQGVLKALLPETGADIKGHMRSYDELLAASGYARRRQDFDDLLRIQDRLWTVLTNRDKDPDQHRLRAAGALSQYDPQNPQWDEVASEVAGQLVDVNPVFVGQWQEALRPVADHLLRPLTKTFSNPEQSELPRTLATSLLADYANDDPDRLTNLVVVADSKAFLTLFPVLQSHGRVAVEKLQAVLARTVEPT